VHSDIAYGLHGLGIAYQILGGTDNLIRAIKFYEDSLKIRRELYPDGVHADIAASLHNLSTAYRGLGGTDDLRKAAEFEQERDKIRRQLPER
jgi:hypothetical protein